MKLFIALQSSKSEIGSGISQFESRDQIDEIILQENKKRCDFFKHYKYNETEKLGTVSK